METKEEQMKYYFVSYVYEEGFGCAYQRIIGLYDLLKSTDMLGHKKRPTILFYKEISEEEYKLNCE